MKRKRLKNNTISAFVYQLTTIICGFLIPRLILDYYGSEINGLVNSITQFLAIIAFLDLGVGAVFQSSLYKPLADNDVENMSKIFVSGQKFFTRLAMILLGYIVVLICLYPFITDYESDFFFVATLIIAMSISVFAQYYFGMANGLFLMADQRGYISNNIQTVTLIMNAIACYVLISIGASIQIVKFSTSCIYLARPIFLKIYVDRNYNLNKHIRYEGEPIKQKWNGLAQHIVSVVLDSTDIIVLTVFSSLSNVSVYSVYYLVIAGIKQILTATTSGLQALMGELYARGDTKELGTFFAWSEWIIHTATTFVFGCTSILILPFVLVYTRGVTDAEYNQPIFSILIVLAYAMYCYRLPYHIIIKAGVHYAQTQRCYIIAAILNILISIFMVKRLGLIGVAIGTLISMLYQVVWMAWYDCRNLIDWPFANFLKQSVTDLITGGAGYILCSIIHIQNYTYRSWIVMGFKVATIWLMLICIINFIFYNEMIMKLWEMTKLCFAKMIKHK